MTDEELNLKLSALSQGDKTAFEEIYNELKTSAFTVVYRITQDRHLSEDILQEFFIRLYRKPPCTPLDKPRAYLMRMVHNLTVDALRKIPRDTDMDSAEISAAYEENADERLDLNEALKRLSEEERQVVVLHINGGLKFRELASVLEMPLGTVLWRYRKAIGRLRDTLNGGE